MAVDLSEKAEAFYQAAKSAYDDSKLAAEKDSRNYLLTAVHFAQKALDIRREPEALGLLQDACIDLREPGLIMELKEKYRF